MVESGWRPDVRGSDGRRSLLTVSISTANDKSTCHPFSLAFSGSLGICAANQASLVLVPGFAR